MDAKTERWLGPMLTELLSRPGGNAALGRFMEHAVGLPVDPERGVDWIGFGQLVRDDLGWDHYPELPPRSRAKPFDDHERTPPNLDRRERGLGSPANAPHGRVVRFQRDQRTRGRPEAT